MKLLPNAALIGAREQSTETGVIRKAFPCDPSTITTYPIRIFDPVTLVAGLMQRATITTTNLLGFSAMATSHPELPTSIAYALPPGDPLTGAPNVTVYVGANSFMCSARPAYGTAISKANIGKMCDLAYALLSPVPVITQGGTAGATAYSYQVVPASQVGKAATIAATTTNTGNAVLSATNFNILTIPQVPGAVTLQIFRGGFLLTEISANPVGTTVFNDIGAVVSTVPADNTAINNSSGFVVNPAGNTNQNIQILALEDADGTVDGRYIIGIVAAKSQYLGAPSS